MFSLFIQSLLQNTISVPPQIFPFGFGDEPLNTGESIGVQCMVNKGDLPVEIRWIVNSSPIISGEQSFTVMKMNARTSSLNIEYLDGVHRGVYKCVASNRAGESEWLTKLDVNGRSSSGYDFVLFVCLDLFEIMP